MNLPPQPGPSTSTAVPVVPGLPPLPGFGPAPSAAPDVGTSRPSSPFTAGVKPLSPSTPLRPPAAPRQSLLRRILRRLEDNRVEGHEVEMTAAERKRKRAEDEASYALLKTILNAIFVTTGLVLLLSVIVVIIYTTFGTCLTIWIDYLYTWSLNESVAGKLPMTKDMNFYFWCVCCDKC